MNRSRWRRHDLAVLSQRFEVYAHRLFDELLCFLKSLTARHASR